MWFNFTKELFQLAQMLHLSIIRPHRGGLVLIGHYKKEVHIGGWKRHGTQFKFYEATISRSQHIILSKQYIWHELSGGCLIKIWHLPD